MKPLPLIEVCKTLNLETQLTEATTIHHVANNCKGIADDTLVFHLNKQEELNINRFNQLNNCYIITDQPILKSSNIKRGHYFYVNDVNQAYRRFVDYYRRLFDIPIVAITGTCGKTTTKEMIKQVLENDHKVTATYKSRNPLRLLHSYLMSIDESTEYGVFETAITHPGNLIESCSYFKPTIGVITNIGLHHLDGCKTLGNYVRTKGEMLAGLNYRGTLIINGDDERIRDLDMSPFKGVILSFGLKKENDFWATNITYGDIGMNFILHYKDQEYKVTVPGFGVHNVYNALAALVVLTALGKKLSWSISKLGQINHIHSHLQFHKGFNNSTVIDDNYSSNPTSIQAALDMLTAKAKDKKKIVVLGRIPYLGEHEKEQYSQIAKMIIQYKIDYLLTVDGTAQSIGLYANSYGMNTDRLYHAENNKEITEILKSLIDSNSVVLFKTPMSDMKSVFHDIISE